MSTKEKNSQAKRIYDKPSKTWFEVTPEQYAEFDRWRTNKRKREQYHGRCMCKREKWWLCDGMCEDCEFHAPGDTLSLDATTTNENGDETCLLDSIASPESDPIDIILDRPKLSRSECCVMRTSRTRILLTLSKLSVLLSDHVSPRQRRNFARNSVKSFLSKSVSAPAAVLVAGVFSKKFLLPSSITPPHLQWEV